jgi:hypothetical protein
VTHFEIVCPDGKTRHLPYANLDDAMFDARLCDTECAFPGAFDGHGNGECPGGLHVVRPVAVTVGGKA